MIYLIGAIVYVFAVGFVGAGYILLSVASAVAREVCDRVPPLLKK